MILWRRTRTEAAEACRSTRYGLGRREPDDCPDVTSAGLSTFAGAPFVPRPRRLAAVSVVGALAVAGAAGSYLAIVNGLGALVGEPVGAEPYPLAVEAPHGTGGGPAHSGLGRGTAVVQARPVAPAPPVPEVRVLPATTPAAVPSTVPPTTAPQATVPRPRQTTALNSPDTEPTDCDCEAPPAPTPTASGSTAPVPIPPAPTPPVPTPHSPSATPSPTGSPEPSASPEPGASSSSAAPSGSDDAASTAGDEAGGRHARHP